MEEKSTKLQIILSQAEIAAIDEWMFANAVTSREEAIRRLCSAALYTDRKKTRDKSFKRTMGEAAQENVVVE